MEGPKLAVSTNNNLDDPTDDFEDQFSSPVVLKRRMTVHTIVS